MTVTHENTLLTGCPVKRVHIKMANDNFEDFTKALISFEKGINDKESLDKIYQVYMDNDYMGLLNDEFDHLIVESCENV